MALQHNLMLLRLNQCWDPFKYVWNGSDYGWNKGRLFINRITDEVKTELGPWERVREEESQKIAQMSIVQLFDYTQHIVDSETISDSLQNIETHHCWIMSHNLRSEEIFTVSGLDAAAEYKQTIISILAKLKSQLAGKTCLTKGNSLGLTKRLLNSLLILGELIIFDDIKNVEKVMAGDISTLDYTALWLVQKRMLKTAEKTNKAKIHEYLSKLSGFILSIDYAFSGNYCHYLERQYNQRRAQRAIERMERAEDREAESVIYLSNRPKRDRRVPQRLNITSTKSKTYLE